MPEAYETNEDLSKKWEDSHVPVSAPSD